MHAIIPRLDVKEKNFHGMLAVGGIAGILEGSVRYGFTVHTAFPGMMLTLIAAFLGGFTGFFLKDFFRTMRGMKPYRGVNNDGWMMGSFLGATLGTLLQVAVSPDGGNIVIGSIVGAFCGAACGAIPDEIITPIWTKMQSRPNNDVSGRHELL